MVMPFRLDMDPVENPVRAVSITPGVRVDWLTSRGRSLAFRVICGGDEDESGPAVNGNQQTWPQIFTGSLINTSRTDFLANACGMCRRNHPTEDRHHRVTQYFRRQI